MHICSFICLQVLNLQQVNSQSLTGSEFPAGSESPMNFDDSPKAPSLVSALVAAATIPYIHLRMKMQNNVAALKFATLQSPPISNQTTGNIYEGSKQHMDAELSHGAQEHDTSI